MDTQVLNETIWAVQDFILDAVNKGAENIRTLSLPKTALTQIKNSGKVGIRVLTSFLGNTWENRIRIALELRKLETEDPELLEATEKSLDM